MVRVIRHRRTPAIKHLDPFTVSEPWRPYVRRILAAHRSYHRSVGDLRAGPLHDRLHDLGRHVDAGVVAGWQLARRGQALTEARHGIDAARLHAQLDGLGDEATPPAGPLVHEELRISTRQALESQLRSAADLDAAVAAVLRHLQVVDARLGEICARTAVVVTGADAGPHPHPPDAAEQLVLLQEALREVELVGRVDVSLPELPSPAAGRP